MFESEGPVPSSDVTAALRDVLSSVRALAPVDAPEQALEVIALCEQLQAVTASLQARQTSAYDEARRTQDRAAGVREEKVGRAVPHEVALAKRCSPHRGRRYVAFANRLVADLPCTLAALSAGETSEWRAMLVAQETGWLSAEHRGEVDAIVGPRLASLGDRQVEAEAKQAAYRLDPQGYVNRLAKAVADRTVSLRPAPDCMTRLSALLPVKQGVAAYAALLKAADSSRAAGDARSRGQAMADTLVERLTGQATAEDVPVTVTVVVPGESLLPGHAQSDEPATVVGFGPVPAFLVRQWMAARSEVPVWIRRLFTDRAGRLVTMETTQRLFTDAQRDFVRMRDQTCRTPYCDAPIRHVDHVDPAARGGPTSLHNAQGLCEACNLTKEAVRYRTPPPGPVPPTERRFRIDLARMRIDRELVYEPAAA